MRPPEDISWVPRGHNGVTLPVADPMIIHWPCRNSLPLRPPVRKMSGRLSAVSNGLNANSGIVFVAIDVAQLQVLIVTKKRITKRI